MNDRNVKQGLSGGWVPVRIGRVEGEGMDVNMIKALFTHV
jgi:hypothetical protein